MEQHQDQSSPAAIDFVFDTGVRLVEKQMEALDRLDAKVAVLWGLLGASIVWLLGALVGERVPWAGGRVLRIGGYLQIPPTAWFYLFHVGILLLILSFLCALVAMYPRRYYVPTNYAEMVSLANHSPQHVKLLTVDTVVQAYKVNGELMEAKTSRVKWALWFGSSGLLLVAVSLWCLRMLRDQPINLWE